jgi:hypothetical protein
MKYKYMGEMTFEDAVKKFGKKLPDITELQKIPKKVLKQSKDQDAWGILLNKNGEINKIPLVRGLGGYDCVYLLYFSPRGVFIVENTKKEKKGD